MNDDVEKELKGAVAHAELDPQSFPEFKKAYEDAKRKGEETFTFKGHEWVVALAKYVVAVLDPLVENEGTLKEQIKGSIEKLYEEALVPLISKILATRGEVEPTVLVMPPEGQPIEKSIVKTVANEIANANALDSVVSLLHAMGSPAVIFVAEGLTADVESHDKAAMEALLHDPRALSKVPQRYGVMVQIFPDGGSPSVGFVEIVGKDGKKTAGGHDPIKHDCRALHRTDVAMPGIVH